MQLWLDSAFTQYVISLVIALYGAVLFTWWWIKNKKASFIFICVTLIFVGDAIERSIQMYARYLRLTLNDLSFLEASPVWAYRGIIGTLVSFAVVVYMTGRIVDAQRGK